MIPDILEFLAPREEKIQFGGRTLVIKEMTSNTETESLRDKVDVSWKILVLCVFREDGTALFTNDDIPRLKASSTSKIAPLINAVNRVNGFNVEDEAKNSDAAQK